VQEAGQSNITRDWLEKIIQQDNSITAEVTKKRVIVVQHSDWNEKHTNKEYLVYVKEHTNYAYIDDGNKDGNQTPKYKGSKKLESKLSAQTTRTRKPESSGIRLMQLFTKNPARVVGSISRCSMDT